MVSKGEFAATIIFFFCLIFIIVLVVIWRVMQLHDKREAAALVEIGEEQSGTTRKRRFSQTEYGGVFQESTVVVQRTRPRYEDGDSDQLQDVHVEKVITQRIETVPQSYSGNVVKYHESFMTQERVQN